MDPPARDDFEARVGEYWDWIAVALFLLVTVDLLTTTVAAGVAGRGAEGNPVVRYLLGQGPVVLVAANLLVLVLAGGFFYGVVEMLRRTPARYRRPFELVFEVWIGVLVAVGLFLLANNLSVIVFGASLI